MVSDKMSANFRKGEFACKCGCGYDDIKQELVDVVQVIRDKINRPITISSGCRCEAHNKRVGGVESSQHRLGTAADLHTPIDPTRLFDIIKELYKEGKIPELGYCQRYTWGCHVDTRPQKARNIFNG